jgi:hypothetical protein
MSATYVTAKTLASFIEIGSKISTKSAITKLPEILTHAASITIKANTPALTALPIFGPIGFEMALVNGLKIKKICKETNASENHKVSSL